MTKLTVQSVGFALNAEEVPWVQPPEHYEAYSKLLVNAKAGSRHFDFRVSIYQPKGYAAEHSHDTAEQVYYVIRGTGTVTLDGETKLVKPNHVIFIPPGVKHSIANTGFEDLVFIVATSPPEEMEF